MKTVLQRVTSAKVTIDEKVCGEIAKGYLLLVGIGKQDTEETVRSMAEKIKKLRLFEDENGKTNLSIADVGGEVLAVSQFTLYANCKKGTRPSFIDAAPPELANRLYEKFLQDCRELFGSVKHGEFGADMKIDLVNDGPFTIVLDSDCM